MKKWEDWELTGNQNGTWRYKREIIKNGHYSVQDNFYFTPEEKRHILRYDVALEHPKKAVISQDSYTEEIDFDAPFRITHTIALDIELERLVQELPPDDGTQPIIMEDLALDPAGFYIRDGVLLEFTGEYTDPFIVPQVSEIGYKAFDTRVGSRSRYLFPSEVILPDCLNKIGKLAFACCGQLQKMVIPDSVEYIGEGAFTGCGLSEGITLPKSIDRIEAYVFKDTKLKSITIPESVKSIGNGAFMNCYSLKSIDIPDSVEEIGEGAFSRCRSLKTVNAPAGIKKLINNMKK